MKLATTSGLFKKTTLFATAFVLAVSSVTAAVPFILSKEVNAANTVHTTNIATWDLTSSKINGHQETVSNGLHVWTTGGNTNGSNRKAAGYKAVATPFPLAQASDSDISFAPGATGPLPGLQLGVDIDGDSDWDGYLVYEPWAYGNGNFWTNKNFGLTSPFAGITNFGTVAEFAEVNPNAKVISIGYSLGTLGSHDDGNSVITKLTAGGTDYTFGLAPLGVPQFTAPTNNAIVNNGNLTVSWTGIAGATSYVTRSSVSNATNSEGVLIDNGGGFIELEWGTNSISNLDLPEGTFYWQVQAKNASQSSAWSSIIKVTIDKTAPVVTNMTQQFEIAQNGRYAVELTFNEAIDTNSLEQGWYEVAGSNKTKFAKRYYSTEQFTANFKDLAGNPVAYQFTITPVVNNSPVVNFIAPTPADGAFVKGTVTSKVNATDDWGIGSYYLRFWKDAYEIGGGGTLVQPNCFSAPGAFLVGTNVSPECSYDTTQLADNTKLIVSAQFQDGHGAWGNAALRTYTVDNTAPTITIKSGTSTVEGTQGANPYSRISFSLYDAAGNLKEVVLNGNVYNRGGKWNDFNWVNITKSQLIEGTNTVTVRDKAGNESSLTFVYDSTAPDAPVLTARAPGGAEFVSGGATTSYDVTADWNDVAGASSYIYKYWNSISNNPYTSANPYVVNGLGSSETTGVFNQGQGKHFMQVFAVDAAGNVSQGSNIFEVTYDTTAPTATISFPAIGNGATSFEVQYSEAVNPLEAANAANYYLTNWVGAGGSGDLAGDAAVVYNPLTNKAVVTFTNAGWYVSPEQLWGVQNVHDLAGNSITPNPTEAYSTPNVAPTNPGTPVASSATTLDTLWTWAGSDDGANGSGVKGYEYKFNGASDWTFTTETFANTLVANDGTYTFVVRAIDNAGNVSGEASATVTIDSTAPEILGDSYTTAANVITPNFTSNDPSATYQWTRVSGPVNGVEISDENVLAPEFTVTTDGTYVYRLVATDGAGNSTEKNLTFTYETPVVPAQPAEPVDNEADDNGVPVTNPVTTFATTPTIVGPGFTNVAVLGQDTDAAANNESQNGEVEGVSTLNDPAQAANSEANQGTFLGLGWYWWLLIIAALAAIGWWIGAAIRNRQAQN